MILTVHPLSGAPVVYEIMPPEATIGRSPACSIVVRDHALSRIHAALLCDGGTWSLQDRGSRNGTKLNGRPVIGSAPLQAGDRIDIGTTFVVFGERSPGAVDADAVARTVSHPGRGEHEEDSVIVGSSPAMVRLRGEIARVAPGTITVLLRGENGTGKELAARLIHRLSTRSAKPMVVINCPAIPASLFEAELFGVEKGVATGVDARPGRLELADGGTVLFDEIGDLDTASQAKLLRFLQERSIERVGGRTARRLDLRIIAATNRDLNELVERGTFRRDLLHRLNAVTITLPPLRERSEDIAEMTSFFLRRLGDARPVSPAAMAMLAAYAYPGNVRELENAVERASLFAAGSAIEPCDLPEALLAAPEPHDEVAELRRRLVDGGESFWTVVREPFLRREISKDVARALVARLRAEAGGGYREMARLLRIEAEHGRLVDFIGRHGLGVP